MPRRKLKVQIDAQRLLEKIGGGIRDVAIATTKHPTIFMAAVMVGASLAQNFNREDANYQDNMNGLFETMKALIPTVAVVQVLPGVLETVSGLKK